MSYPKDPPTLFIDIDGSLLRHEISTLCCDTGHVPTVLPGTINKLMGWKSKGYKIILTTGRQASREATEAQLKMLGIPYDQLITDVGSGVRVLINDKKPDGTITAIAFSPDRDQGVGDIEI